MGKLLIHSSHGAEDPERATLPFVIANNAALAGQDVVVMLTIEGVRVATKGGADRIEHQGLPPLRELLPEYVSNGGQVWACQSCTKPRGITEADLVDGARIAAAMQVVEYLSQGASSLTI
jgi:predicted peroxiredoxin